jgi:hypothetical protein
MKVASLLTLLLIISCSHQRNDHIDEVHLLQSSASVAEKNIIVTQKYISNCNSLNKNQKANLIKFHEKSQSEMSDLEQDLTRTKLVLVKTLLEPKVDTKIAGMVRKELKRLEKVKSDKTLEIYQEAQNFISPIKDIAVREHLYNAFMFKGNNQF